MKNATKLILLVWVACFAKQTLSAQCTTATNGQWPSTTVVLNNSATPTVLATNCFCSEYSVCSNVQNGKSYTVTSSVSTDYITITTTTNAVIAFGVQPLTFTAPSAANIRVYRHLSSACGAASVNRTITVTCTNCVAVPPTPPANDACSGAIALTPDPSCIPVAGSTLNATDNNETPDCTIGTENAVWYKFVATATSHVVGVQGGTGFDAVIGAVVGCGSATRPTGGICTDDGLDAEIEVLSLSSLTIGNTYYLQVYDYQGDATSSSTFNICVVTPPANDNCTSATNLGTGNTISTTGTNTGSTGSTAGDVSCDIGGGGVPDVWYKFTTDSNGGDATISVGGTGLDIVIATYSSCGGTQTGCADGFGTGSNESITLTGLAANTTVFLRVYEFNGLEGTFNINIAGTALPLELKSFTGKTESSANLLQWETFTEKNVQWHIVERSIDGTIWSETGRNPGQADSRSILKYELEDRAPLAKAYYRLRSVDFDGMENRSSSIVLTRAGDHFGITAVFPSPTKDRATVQFTSPTEDNLNIRLIDVAGRIVLDQQFSAEKGVNEVPLELADLQAGIYQITISNGTTNAAPARIVKE